MFNKLIFVLLLIGLLAAAFIVAVYFDQSKEWDKPVPDSNSTIIIHEK